MAKRKSEKSRKPVKTVVVDKYPFDPDNEESYNATPEEIFLLRLVPGLDKYSPFQFANDRILQFLKQSGCESANYEKYTFSEVVKAVKQCHMDGLRDLTRSWEVAYVRLRQEWSNRFLWTTRPNVLQYWHKREGKAIEEIIKYKCPRGRKPRPWPFFEGGKQFYDPTKDLDHIFLAVGIKLDQLFSTKVFIADEMWSIILEKAKVCIHPAFTYSDINLRYSFGPHFEGQIMTYETVAVLWQFCEADLEAHGFTVDHCRQNDNDGATDVTLVDFMENFCESQGYDVESKRNLLYKQNANKNIELPKTGRPWKRGKTKVFRVEDLRVCWPQYRQIIPTLPPLKVQKSDI